MTTYSWNTGTSGDWNTAADWAGGGIPNSATADVVIDAGPVTAPYTVDISAAESIEVNSIELNVVNNVHNLNSTYRGAVLEVDGTLSFAPGSAGLIGGPLQNEVIVNGGTINNAGTVNAFVLAEGISTFTGTNAIYFTNWLESLGTVTIATSSIGEYNATTDTLFDGIWQAKGANDTINLGGGAGKLIVNIATITGPGTDLPGTSIPGWTELLFDGPGAAINEWNGTSYVSVESSISLIENNTTIVVDPDPDTNAPTNYTTTKPFTIGNGGFFDQVNGTLSTGGLTILSGGTLTGAPFVVGNVVNDGTVLVSGGQLTMTGSVTGTGVMSFSSGVGTLDVASVGAGQTVVLQGNDILRLETPATFNGTLADFGGNQLELIGVVANSGTLSGGKLNLYEGATLVDAIAMGGTVPAISVQTVGSNSIVTFGSIAPFVTAGAAATYAAGAAPVTLDATLTASDPNTNTLVGASVAISAGFAGGDTLSVAAPQAGITASYNASSGVLTLTGSATIATYEAELDSVQYAGIGDPTVGGTDLSRTITWTINDGSTTASANSSLTTSFVSHPDNDILFQNVGGQLALWQMAGTTISAYGTLGPNPGPTWFAMATGPFFTGDSSDVAWQNSNGSVAIWQANGTTLLGGGLVSANPGTSWHIMGSGDFYEDGGQDILWQNDSGQVALWDMSGSTIYQSGLIADPGPTWHIRGTGNFFGDGNDDVLLQNDNGGIAMWDMKGTSIVQGGTVAANPGPSWRIEGTGDFFGNGDTDILWRNDDGSVAVWDMKGDTIVQGGTIANPGPTWHVVGTGDFNNDGKTDILLQNENGSVAEWDMSGTSIIGGAVITNPGTSWNVVSNDTMRFIDSGAAGETIAATPTTPDEFIFTSAAAGMHTITGFNTVQDIIELPGASFASFTAVQAATTSTSGGALINIGNGATLLLSGVSSTSLHASNFALT
jgi:hypothetical protein